MVFQWSGFSKVWFSQLWFFKGVVFPRCGFSKVWSLLEAEEDAAGLKMKETLEQLHQSGIFVKNKQIDLQFVKNKQKK